MQVTVKNGVYDTSELYTKTKTNVETIESCLRGIPSDVIEHPIGFIIPLGTLGNVTNAEAQFKSNFHIIAYTISEDLINKDKGTDFEDFNLADRIQEQGQISKLAKKLDELAEASLGKGWKITIFNVKLSVAIDSMCKGNNDVDTMKKSMDDLYAIVKNRLSILTKSSDEEIWPHELIELFYTPLRALSAKFSKVLKSQSKSEDKISKLDKMGKPKLDKICEGILIETLVFDRYANGLRLLTNVELFASSKIRAHSVDNDDIYLFVLKARVRGEELDFKPIRQFSGKSKITSLDNESGCTRRIIYNLVNKNYKHWSYIAIPSTLRIDLEASEA